MSASYYQITCPTCGAKPGEECSGGGCHEERFATSRGLQASYAPREVAEAFSLYLNSSVAMALFSKLLLYRASGDNARVVVKHAGKNYRVSIHRTNGDVEHFNRDGKE